LANTRPHSGSRRNQPQGIKVSGIWCGDIFQICTAWRSADDSQRHGGVGCMHVGSSAPHAISPHAYHGSRRSSGVHVVPSCFHARNGSCFLRFFSNGKTSSKHKATEDCTTVSSFIHERTQQNEKKISTHGKRNGSGRGRARRAGKKWLAGSRLAATGHEEKGSTQGRAHEQGDSLAARPWLLRLQPRGVGHDEACRGTQVAWQHDGWQGARCSSAARRRLRIGGREDTK
jgi:hypothetical protein